MEKSLSTFVLRLISVLTSAFMRLKPSQVVTRAVQPHTFGKRREAQSLDERTQPGESNG